jgi:hypothetical protein
MVFDPLLYRDDKTTPISHTMRPATVVARYGLREYVGGCLAIYPDLVDVLFDHRPGRVSGGHFTRTVEVIP